MSPPDLTAVLVEVQESGEAGRPALDRLVPMVYGELRRMAHAQLVYDGNRLTLDTTGLVHEAYLKLVDGSRAPVKSRAYFFGAAARAMRQVLVDAARRRGRDKRGGGERPVGLDEMPVAVDVLAEELVELDEGLERLARTHPRPAEVLECRFFGGLSVAETAEALQVTERTVNRDWSFARAWLRRELTQDAEAE